MSGLFGGGKSRSPATPPPPDPIEEVRKERRRKQESERKEITEANRQRFVSLLGGRRITGRKVGQPGILSNPGGSRFNPLNPEG